MDLVELECPWICEQDDLLDERANKHRKHDKHKSYSKRNVPMEKCYRLRIWAVGFSVLRLGAQVHDRETLNPAYPARAQIG
jgi:hypothetical protein